MGHGSAAVEGKDLAHQSFKVVEVEPCPVRRKEKVCCPLPVQSLWGKISYFAHFQLRLSHGAQVQDGLHTAVFIYFLCGNAVLLPWYASVLANKHKRM